VAPFDTFVQVDPDEISITQAAVKSGASLETNYDECEIRIDPKDVKLIALRVEERGILEEDDE